ncbi:MAG: MFS transporter [Candidatus Puniceispirillaceae bacterium]
MSFAIFLRLSKTTGITEFQVLNSVSSPSFFSRLLMQLSLRIPSVTLLALFASTALVGLTLVTPAVPALKDDFGISYNLAQMTISAFLIAVGIGQIFVGILSDRFGRRPVFLTGSSLFCLASLAAAFAPSAEWLIASRAFQGLGAAALLTMSRVVVNDVFEREKAANILSTITAIYAIIPVLALSMGGIIVDQFGWRMTLYIIAVISVIMLYHATFSVAETHHNRLQQLRLTDFLSAFRAVITNRFWIYFSICAGMQIGIFQAMTGFMSYHFIRLGASLSEFGLFFSFVSIGYICGNVMIRFFGHHASLSKWVWIGSIVSVVIILIMWGMNEAGFLTPYSLSALLFCFGFGNGLTIANAIIGSLTNTGQNAGTAGGLGGTAHMSFGGIAGGIIILAGGATNFTTCMIIILMMALASLVASQLARGLIAE